MTSIVPLGDHAVLINFEQQINPEIHQQVIDLASQIERASIRGIKFVSPAYCSLTVGYDPSKLSYIDLVNRIRMFSQLSARSTHSGCRKITIPVCYDLKYALDLAEVSRLSGLSKKEIIAIHSGETYRVYLLGFLPGFPYLGTLPENLQLPRKKAPGLRIPERSVAIAGKQTGIYPAESPGGWHILGRTPLPLFRLKPEFSFVLKPGDLVNFNPVNLKEYELLTGQLAENKFDWNSVYE